MTNNTYSNVVEKGIFCKYDWFSCIFNNACIQDIINWLLVPDLFEDYSQAVCEVGMNTSLRFSSNCINFEIPYQDAVMSPNYIEGNALQEFFFDRLPKIKLDITGSGLDYLRLQGVVPEEHFTVIPFDEYHLTRLDVACDLVNYMGDFYENTAGYLFGIQFDRNIALDRVPVMHRTSSVSFSLKSGNNKTIYIGSTSSDKLLRIYDKKFQMMPKGVWKESCPYGDDCQSWIRLEWQLRREQAEAYLYKGNKNKNITEYYCDILYTIYKLYAFKDVYQSRVNNPVACKFWDDLFDFDEIPNIIQNAKYVSYVNREEQILNNYKRNMHNLSIVYAMYGRQKLYSDIQDYLHYLNTPSQDERFEYIRRRKLNKWLKDYNEIGKENMPHIILNSGKIICKYD